MVKSLCFLSFMLSAGQVFAAAPVLPLGSVYTYSYCAGDTNSPCDGEDSKTLEITVARIEVTANQPKPSYVFEVSNEGRKYEVKIEQDLWDSRIRKMVAYATDKKVCEDGTLSNGRFDSAATSNRKFEGQDVEGCRTGSDSEYQSAGTFLYKRPSPMPLRVSGGGRWPNGTGGGFRDFEVVKRYYRDRFFVAAEYLEFLGTPATPDSNFDISFTLQEIK